VHTSFEDSSAKTLDYKPTIIRKRLGSKEFSTVVAYASPREERDKQLKTYGRITFNYYPQLTANQLTKATIQGKVRAKLVPYTISHHLDETHNEQVMLTLFSVWRRLEFLGFTHFIAQDSHADPRANRDSSLLAQLADIYDAIDITLSLGHMNEDQFSPVHSPEFLQLKSTIAGKTPLRDGTWCFKLLSLITMDLFQEEPAITFHFYDKNDRVIRLAAVPACALDDVFGVSGFVYGRYHEPVKPIDYAHSLTHRKKSWKYLHLFKFDEVVETLPIGRAIVGYSGYRLSRDEFLQQAGKQSILSNDKGNQVVFDMKNEFVSELNLASPEDEKTFNEALRTDLFVGDENIRRFFDGRVHSVLDFFKPEALSKDYLNTFSRR